MRSVLVSTRKSPYQRMAESITHPSSSSSSSSSVLLLQSTLNLQKANMTASYTTHNKIKNNSQFKPLELNNALGLNKLICYESVRRYSVNAKNISEANYSSTSHRNRYRFYNKQKYTNNVQRTFRQNEPRSSNNLESIRKEYYVLMREFERRCKNLFATTEHMYHEQQHSQVNHKELLEQEKERKENVNNINNDKGSKNTEQKEESNNDTNKMYEWNYKDANEENNSTFMGDYNSNDYSDDELRVQDQRLLEQLGVTELFSLYKDKNKKIEDNGSKSVKDENKPENKSLLEVYGDENLGIMESAMENKHETKTTSNNYEMQEEMRRFIEVMCDVLCKARFSPFVWLDKCVHIIKEHYVTLSTQEALLLAMKNDENRLTENNKNKNINEDAIVEAEEMILSSWITLKAATMLLKSSCERIRGKRIKMKLYLAHPNLLYKEQHVLKRKEMERLKENINSNELKNNIMDTKITVNNIKVDTNNNFVSVEYLLNKLAKETNDMRYVLHFFSCKLTTPHNVNKDVNESDCTKSSSSSKGDENTINKWEATSYKSQLASLFDKCKTTNTCSDVNVIDETEFQFILLFVQAYVELAAELCEIEPNTNTKIVTHLQLQTYEVVQAVMEDLMTFLERNAKILRDSNYENRNKVEYRKQYDINNEDRIHSVKCVIHVNEETIRSICCNAIRVFAFNPSGFENGYSLFVRFLQWKELHDVNQSKIHKPSSNTSSPPEEYVKRESEAECTEVESMASNLHDSSEELEKPNYSRKKKEEDDEGSEDKRNLCVVQNENSNIYERRSSFQELTRVYNEDALYFIDALTHNFTSTALLCQTITVSNHNNSNSKKVKNRFGSNRNYNNNNNNTLVYNYDMIANLFVKLIKETEIGYKMPLCTTLTRCTFIHLLHSLSHVCTMNQFSKIGVNSAKNNNISNNSSSLAVWGYDWLHNMYKTVMENTSLEMHRQDVNSEHEHDRILLAALQAMSSCASSASSINIKYTVSDAMETLFIHNNDENEDSNSSVESDNKINDDNGSNSENCEKEETDKETFNNYNIKEKSKIYKLLSKDVNNNETEMWSNNALLLFNKLQRPHGTLKMTEREVALQNVLLKLFNFVPCYRVILSNILLRNSLSNCNNNVINSTSIKEAKRIHVQNANALIQSTTEQAEIKFTRYMSYLQQQSYIPINVRHGLVVQFLIIYCSLMDFTSLVQDYEMIHMNQQAEIEKQEDTVKLISDFSDITAMMYVLLDQTTLHTTRKNQEEEQQQNNNNNNMSRDLYAARTFYLHLLVFYCQLQTRVTQQHKFQEITNDNINTNNENSVKKTQHLIFSSQVEADNAFCMLQEWVETLCGVYKVQAVPLCVLELLHSLHNLLVKYSSGESNIIRNSYNNVCATKLINFIQEISQNLKCEGDDDNSKDESSTEEYNKDDDNTKCDSLSLCLHWCSVWTEQESKREWNALGSLSVFSQHLQELLTKYNNFTNEYNKRVECNVNENMNDDKICTREEATNNIDDNHNSSVVVYFRTNTSKQYNRIFVNVNN